MLHRGMPGELLERNRLWTCQIIDLSLSREQQDLMQSPVL